MAKRAQPVEADPSPAPARSGGFDAPAALLILALACAHLALALHVPPAPDECYYWEWSRRPALGYYDQGPMIAWLIWLGRALAGDTPLGLRLPSIVAAALSNVLVYAIARRMAGPGAGRLAVLMLSATPLAMAGGFMATYDVPLALCWLGCIWFSLLAVEGGQRRHWAALGVCFGLGMLSKHTMALYPLCLLGALASWRPGRSWLTRPEPYLALALGLAVYAPNLAWQHGHGWATVRHLAHLSGAVSDSTAVRRIGDLLGSQAGVLTPLLFLGMLWASTRATGKGRAVGGFAWPLVAAASWPVLAFFILMAARSKVQANWPLCAWLSLAPAYAALVVRSGGRARGFAATAVTVAALLSLLIALPRQRVQAGIRIPWKWDQTRKMQGGPQIAAAVQAVRREMARGGRRVAVAGTTYDAAARLAFYLPYQPRTVCLFLGTRINAYTDWNAEGGLTPGSDAVVLDGLPAWDPNHPKLQRVFRRVEMVRKPILVMYEGVYPDPVDTLYIYKCYGYRPDPQYETPTSG